MPKELRVHGVSGTPPADLLYTAPVTYDGSIDESKVYEANRDTWEVKAYHWGSLTSRSSLTALWILLAPFAMANVAGWVSEKPNAWNRTWVRLAGLFLTGVFFAQVANLMLDVPAAADTSKDALAWIFGVGAFALVWGIGHLSAQSSFDQWSIWERLRRNFSPLLDDMDPRGSGDWRDPTAGCALLGPSMWGKPTLVHRLRRIHLTFGMAAIAMVAGRGTDSALVWRTAFFVLGLCLLLLVSTTGRTATNLLILRLTALVPIAGLGLMVWAVVAVANASAIGPAADDVSFQFSLGLGAATAMAFFADVALTRGRGGWTTAGLLGVGAFLGATLGLAGSMLSENLFFDDARTNPETFNGGASFVTLGMLGMALVIGLAFVVFMFLPALQPSQSRLRRAVLRGRSLVTVAGVYGLVAGAAAAILSFGDGGWDQQNLSLDSLGLSAWVEDPQNMVTILGIDFDPTSPMGWAKVLMLVIPAGLIARSAIGGLLNGQDSRRQVSILWDLGSFWPRWFHPLAPPAYGPFAVDKMKRVLEDEKPDVLAAHSQGSLVSAVTLNLDPTVVAPKLLVTYGSQLGHLYPRLFPGVGFDQLIAGTNTKVNGRWLNLWRDTDPIGGQQVAALGGQNWAVVADQGHSRYELTPEFCAARKAYDGGGLVRPTGPALADCWNQ